MTQDEAKKMVVKYGSIRQAAATAGMAYTTFRDVYHARSRAGERRSVKSSVTPPASVQMKHKKSLSDFRSAYDKSYIVPKKVRTGLAALGASWEYETDFAKSITVSLSDLGMFRDEFAEHIVQVKEGRRIWAGTKALAQQMREMI